MIAYRPDETLSSRVEKLARQGLSPAEIAARLQVSWRSVMAVLPDDCRPNPARDVPIGRSWAFTEHRTMAEVLSAEPPAGGSANSDMALERMNSDAHG